MSPSYNNTAFVDFNVPLGRSLWTSGDLPYLRNNNIYTRTLTAVFVNMEAF